ncbi:MAG TPA: N-acetylmuramoyl-L-alanine amidase [Ruminococcaceae bacterium]|nr:N-acetylmuramoyl-L-alanine amidase [Oscillospiraceae bacterium]
MREISLKITDDFLPKASCCREGTEHGKRWIVIHTTGNSAKGANAKNHAKYLQSLAKSGGKYLSWHYTVDDSEIYHHLPDNEIAWHAGDGRKDDGGNISGIGIEICVNADGNFEKAVLNAAMLTAKLIKENGLSIANVKQHYDFSGKNCPKELRQGDGWQGFLSLVQGFLSDDRQTLYRVQAGAFKSYENALEFKRQLNQKGIDCFIAKE